MSAPCEAGAGMSADWLPDAYRQMTLIRLFEEAVLSCMRDGLVAGAVHPYTGQEAVAVGVLGARDEQEWVVSFYRCHGHALAAGSPPQALMREILGRAGGVCGGKAGSMHLTDRSAHLIGASSIVGGQLPLAAGVAMAEKAEHPGRAVIVFCGDGALGAGVSYETLTLAALFGLPLLIVCEDNGWQDQTLSAQVRVLPPIDLVRGLGLACSEVDGNDVEEIRAATVRALADVRAGCGPHVLVAHTYLRQFHSQMGTEPALEYRPSTERGAWSLRDPLDLLRVRLPAAETIHAEVAATVAALVADATEAPFPDPSDAWHPVTVASWPVAHPVTATSSPSAGSEGAR